MGNDNWRDYVAPPQPGWICPVCKNVYAPFVYVCPECGGMNKVAKWQPLKGFTMRDGMVHFEDDESDSNGK